MGRLTTHVLDTMAGAPAAGLAIELWTVGEGARRLKATDVVPEPAPGLVAIDHRTMEYPDHASQLRTVEYRRTAGYADHVKESIDNHVESASTLTPNPAALAGTLDTEPSRQL